MMSWKPIHPPPMDSFANMGTLPTWEKVLTNLIKPPDWQFKWTNHKLPEPKAAKPDLWDPATSFWVPQSCANFFKYPLYIYISRMIVISSNDVMIIWHTCTSTSIPELFFPSAMHEPSQNLITHFLYLWHIYIYIYIYKIVVTIIY